MAKDPIFSPLTKRSAALPADLKMPAVSGTTDTMLEFALRQRLRAQRGQAAVERGFGRGGQGGLHVRRRGGRAPRVARVAARQRHERARPVGGALLAEVPGEEHEQLVQVRDQRGVHVHLDAEVFHHRDALGARDAACGTAQQVLFHAAGRGITRHIDGAQHG